MRKPDFSCMIKVLCKERQTLMDIITSANNGQMKNIVALQKKAKERRSQRAFVVEGPRMAFEAPKEWLKALYVSEHFCQDPDNMALLEAYGGSYTVVSDSVLKAVSDTQSPQGVLAIVAMPSYELEDLLQGDQTHLLILESVQDPGNLGTMLRTGEGAGATGIVMNKTTVDLFNPKTIRSTMGSLYRMPFYVAEDLPSVMKDLQSRGVKLYAAHLRGQMSYDDPDYTGPCGFLIGNEGNGLSDEIADLADAYIRIPMEGKVESLNAAISATLLMYECSRQRRRGGSHADLV